MISVQWPKICDTISICPIKYAYNFIVIGFVVFINWWINISLPVLGKTVYGCSVSLEGTQKDMDKMDQHQTTSKHNEVWIMCTILGIFGHPGHDLSIRKLMKTYFWEVGVHHWMWTGYSLSVHGSFGILWRNMLIPIHCVWTRAIWPLSLGAHFLLIVWMGIRVKIMPCDTTCSDITWYFVTKSSGYVYGKWQIKVLSIKVWKRISVMVCKKSAYPNCSGRVITAPEDLWLLRKT